MSRGLRSALLGAVVVSSFALASCGDDSNAETDVDTAAEPADDADDGGAATSVAPNGEEVEVLALDNNFRPEDTEIVAGTTVLWENGGRNDHNIVPVDDTESWGVDIEEFHPGDAYSFTFTAPGEYHYYCTLHGTPDFGMTGTIVVTG